MKRLSRKTNSPQSPSGQVSPFTLRNFVPQTPLKQKRGSLEVGLSHRGTYKPSWAGGHPLHPWRTESMKSSQPLAFSSQLYKESMVSTPEQALVSYPQQKIWESTPSLLIRRLVRRSAREGELNLFYILF